ncbi:hypothetical protein F5148DRAFT_1157690, partial [Russula earlei]
MGPGPAVLGILHWSSSCGALVSSLCASWEDDTTGDGGAARDWPETRQGTGVYPAKCTALPMLYGMRSNKRGTARRACSTTKKQNCLWLLFGTVQGPASYLSQV